jgi:FtsH-binding integral membrane protein
MANSSIYNRLLPQLRNTTGMKGGATAFNGQKLWNLIIKKKEFLILVFANLIAQLGITYYVMNKSDNPDIGFWPLFIMQIIIIFILALIPMPPIVKFLIFGLFSWTFGLTMSHLKTIYDPQIIEVAILGTITIFGVMLAAGVALVGFGIYLGYQFGAFLLLSLLALIIARLVYILGPQLSISNKVLAYIGLGLFSLFVIYDTNQILSRDYRGDFITASMDYYLDILNLFSNLLSVNDNN